MNTDHLFGFNELGDNEKKADFKDLIIAFVIVLFFHSTSNLIDYTIGKLFKTNKARIITYILLLLTALLLLHSLESSFSKLA